MSRIVGIRWRRADPIAYADAGELEVARNTYVVVQVEKGQELGWVAREPQDVVWTQPEGEKLATLLRIATPGDIGRLRHNRDMEIDAFDLARNKVQTFQLPMKIIDAHYTFDRACLIVTFGADGRVDFRPLLHELGSALRCRVELRQVGDRDVAKVAGGLGRCGRGLCCNMWLTKFDAISVRMAKEQALPISAEGLAGGCGRLRCCIRFEYEQYRQINKALPRIGEQVGTPKGRATVIVGHRLRETVSVRYEDDLVLEWPLVQLERRATSKN